MKKIIKSFLSVFLLVITLSFLTSCLTQTPGVATLTYKKEAQSKVEFYFSQYKTEDYTVENYQLIIDIAEDGKDEIKKANLIEEVDQILSNTISQMEDVVKIDHVQVAKDNALARWNEFTEEMLAKESEYSVENFNTIKELLDEGIESINSAVTVEGVEQRYNIAKERVDAIDNLEEETLKTLAAKQQEAVEALSAYYETFDLSEYNEAGKTELAQIVINGIDSIRATKELADIETELTNAKALMDVVERRPRTVKEVKEFEADEVVKVEGVVIGFGGNGTWSEILIKDLTTMDIIGIKSTKIYDKGDVIRLFATVAISENQTELGKKYLADPTDIEVVSSGFEYTLDLESAVELKTQEDLQTIPDSAEYVLFKFNPVNMYGNMYESSKDFSKAYYRVSFNKDATALNDIRIKNEQDTNISVGFRVNYIERNLGENWTAKWFGQTEYVSGGYPGHVYSGTVYALYVGGNGYYVQFTILEESHIIANTEMQEGRVNAYNALAEGFASFDEDKYLPENYKVIEELNDACEKAIKHAVSVEEMNQAVQNALDEMKKVEKIKVVKNVDLVIPTKTTYEQYEAIDLTDGKAVVVFDDESTYEIELTSEHVSSFSSDVVGAAVVVLKVSFNEVEYTLEYNIEVTQAASKPLSVSEVKAKAKDEEVFVEGVVIGKAGNGTWQEILIKDVNTMDIIGLRNNNGINVDTSAKTGDLIRLNAKITESANETEKGKLYLTYVDGLSIISENNAITFDLEQAVSFTTQDEFATFVKDGKANAYKLVKITGDIYANTYGDTFSSMYFRFHLNAEATKLAQIKVENETGTAVSLALRNSYVSDNAGSNWADTMFGVTDVVKGTYPGIKFTGTVYVLFVGGNKYYAQFTILDSAHIIKA